MSRRRVLVVSAVLLAGGAFSAPAFSAKQSERLRKANALVVEALQSELAGDNDRRSRELENALQEASQFAPALWHSGFVRVDKRWLKVDEAVAPEAADPRLAAYRVARAKHADTVEGQFALAQWCAGKKLWDQQRAHLSRVIEFAPNHGEAHRLLGQRLVGGQWQTEAELRQAQLYAQRQAADLANWRPRLEALADRLGHENQRLRVAAREELAQIKDPSAVPALEAVLARHSEAAAQAALESLSAIPSPEATQALARLALASPWPAVCDEAARRLGARDKHHYVPYLLSGLTSPLRTRALLLTAPSGEVYYRHVFFREGQEQNAVAAADTDYRPTLVFAQNIGEWRTARQMLQTARLNDALGTARNREVAVARQNAMTNAVNAQISDLLSKATQTQGRVTAEDWWAWWEDHEEMYNDGPKPVYTYYRYHEGLKVRDPFQYLPPPPPRKHSCLVAGTPVWTESGMRSIEQIQVGDRVLAQDVGSGELAFKPVLRTSVREPAEIFALTVGDQTLRCTGGHPFWVVGRGWVKARALKSGQPLHGVAGAAPLKEIASQGKEATYNLVVADFHSYFVGPSKLLTHDVTSRAPSSTVLPGLEAE